MKLWWKIIKEQRSRIEELQKEADLFVEKLESAADEIEKLQNDLSKTLQHNETLTKTINNISTDIFNFKKYTDTLRDPDSGYIVDWDALMGLIKAADQMLSKFDVMFVNDINVEYSNKPLDLELKKYPSYYDPYNKEKKKEEEKE